MLLSKFFLPLIKEQPKEASIISHSLMLRAGLVTQAASGIYTWLPLGLKVLDKVNQIIKKNLDQVGCLELLMPCIQPADLWNESGRFDAYGKELLRIKDRHNNDLLFSPTAEELVTDIFRKAIKSYKDLPKILYQTQWKFRDEIRPRFGVMRAREFYMKDAYSFDLDKASALKTYDLMYDTYYKIFSDLGLRAVAVKADSGPIGGDCSHEFHVLANTGESTIYYDARLEEETDLQKRKELYAVTDEKHVEGTCKEEYLRSKKGIEVGHVFYIGAEKYAEKMKAFVTNKEGQNIPAHMGCYGIGISRLIGAIIEASHDSKGIIWPKQVAPFDVSIINIHPNSHEANKAAFDFYNKLQKLGFSVLLDDKDQSAGSKFATHDLIGIPSHVIISEKMIQSGKFELKDRATDQITLLSFEEILNNLSIT